MAKEKKEKKAKKAKKAKGFFTDFKAFISRGNAVDLAVGVVIGGAFSAIVNALVNILLNICMWRVPGGLKGLVTVLPAASDAQRAPEGYKTVYTVSEFLAQEFNATQAGMYTQHGSKYYYNGCAIIDWGSLINAVVSFIIIAFVLFVLIKSIAYFQNVKKELEEKAKEEYYQRHPEERPAPVEPGKPEPTQVELLSEIRDLLKAKK